MNRQDAKAAKVRVGIVFIGIKNLGVLGALAVKRLWRLNLES
jgi:hypothetical protein